MSFWRICAKAYSSTAFSGEGAALYPGRWNAAGVRVVYLAGSISLGVLEVLVHLDSKSALRAFGQFSVEINSKDIEILSDTALPLDWQQLPDPYAVSTQTVGSEWVKSGRSLALRVPSAVIPKESNLLLNPLHPRFSSVVLGGLEDLAIDPRLLKTV